MKLSQLFTKTSRDVSADEVSKNAQLLIRAGYIHKTMAGVYAFLPLGLRVMRRIEDIVRKNMNQVGGQEGLLNSLHPKDLWVKADNRWDTLDILFRLKSQTGAEYALAQSNEEQITTIAREYIRSWKDLPEYKPYIYTYSENITEAFDTVQHRRTVQCIIYNPTTDKYLVTDDPFRVASRYASYPVGGGIETGESWEMAAFREIIEETGINSSELSQPRYLGQIKQSFFAPPFRNLTPKKRILFSDIVYFETNSTLEGFIDPEKIEFKEYSVWRTFEQINNDVLPGYAWVLNNLQELLAKPFTLQYPFAAYQIQVKFRDEIRSKAGLLRGREFRMKDMYDFHASSESQDAYYEVVKDQYLKIYQEMGIDAFAVRASGGAFTKFSHEFQAITDAGEDWTVIWSNGVRDNLEISKGYPTDTNKESLGPKLLREDLGSDIKSVQNHADHAKVTTSRIMKTVLFCTNQDKPQYIGVCLRGDLQINEELLIQALEGTSADGFVISEATEDQMKVIGAVRGRTTSIAEQAEKYSEPIIWFFDKSLQGAKGMVASIYSQVDIQRDCVRPLKYTCLSEVQVGFSQEDNPDVYCQSVVRSAEVGNIFKLGTKWTKESAMNVSYLDQNNELKHPLMSCYGIGTTRCMGVIAEVCSDEVGLKWPKSVTPYQVHLITQTSDKDPIEIRHRVYDLAQAIYDGKTTFTNHQFDEVLWDDRAGINMGAKLTDAELIGCPTIIIISKRSLENGGVEVRDRNSGESKIIELM